MDETLGDIPDLRPDLDALIPSHTFVGDPLAEGVLMAHQAAWMGDPAPLKVMEKGRRTGITWTEALDAVLIAGSAPSAGGDDYWYIGDIADKGVQFIRDAAHFAQIIAGAALTVEEFLFRDQRADGSSRDILGRRITFASGHRVCALSGRPENIRGLQGVVCIDEAAFHRDVQAVIDACTALLIWGGRLRIISSHNGDDNPFAVFVKDCRKDLYPYSVHRVTFEDAVDNGLYERVCLARGAHATEAGFRDWYGLVLGGYGPRHDIRDEELFCVPRRGSGVYFTRALIEQCQAPGIPVVRLTKPAGYELRPERLGEVSAWFEDVVRPALVSSIDPFRRCVLGSDFGRSGDLSVDWILQDTGGGRWRTGIILELRNLPFDCQLLVARRLIRALPLFGGAKLDARGNGQAHAEALMQEFGSALIECVMLTAQWYATHFPPYRAAYEDQSIVVPESEDIVADHRLVELVRGRPTIADRHVKGSDGEQRHGDSAVAGVLAYAAAREGLGVVEFVSGGPRESVWSPEEAPVHPLFSPRSGWQTGGTYGADDLPTPGRGGGWRGY